MLKIVMHRACAVNFVQTLPLVVSNTASRLVNLKPLRLGTSSNKDHNSDRLTSVTVEREEVIAECGVPSLPEIGTIVSACVTHVNSPSQLYIFFPHGISDLRVSEDSDVYEENQENFAALFEAMREHYKNLPRTLRPTLPACGELLVHCRAAPGGAECLRARVLDVIFLDVGNIAWVKEDQLQPLVIQFSHMPPQAIESWLVGVDSDARWNIKAAAFLKDITNDRILVGYVDEVHRESHRIGIHLYSTEDGEDLDINAAVQEYVERCKQLQSCPGNSSE
ncbi:tudor domain-containing protein 5-like isoform X2 [Penaeus chinensis]|uniref:tudor domain-containing protein 5-like isoform X2 n=1 Tax=Penaeus chinensis TaxID=139456 RepID=UPI001FB5932A|nr:tudor domain-containing protein 5-like isoform X2 [Penaeus chinensis]